MTAPTKRGSYATGVARRIQILEATEKLVREHGHESTTMRMVADSIGITDPAVHYYFPTKDELFVALLRYRDAKAADRIGATVTLAGLIRIVAENQRDGKAIRLFAALASSASAPDHPAHTYFDERYHTITSDLAADITRIADVEPARADAIATLLVAASDGLQTRWLVNRDIDMVAEMELLLDELIGSAWRLH